MANPPVRPAASAEQAAARGMVMGLLTLRKMGLITDEEVREQCEMILGHVPDSAEALELQGQALARIVRWN